MKEDSENKAMVTINKSEEISELKDLIIETIGELKSNKKSEGISTGFYNLDYITRGLHNSSFIVIASRPGMGQTTLAYNIVTNVAIKEKIPVLIFNLDSRKEQSIKRIISSEAMVEHIKMYKGNLDEQDWEKIEKGIKELSQAEIYIDDTPCNPISQIEEKCKRLKKEKNIGLILIDYMQLVGYEIELNRTQGLLDISNRLKLLAKELNIPIIVCSKMSREPEKRFDKGKDPRPVLQDLRPADYLLEDADVIMFLYRDDYYFENTEMKNVAEVEVAKNKYGPRGLIEIKSLLQYAKFEDLEKWEEKK